jgi:hypothetical protein
MAWSAEPALEGATERGIAMRLQQRVPLLDVMKSRPPDADG